MSFIKELWDILISIYDTFMNYYGGRGYLALMLVAAVCLFVLYKEDRRFIWPVLLMMFLVFNPVLYKYLFHRLVFWRMFWTIPEVLIIALAAARMVKRCRKDRDKLLLMAVLSAVIIIVGTNVHKHGSFYTADNPYKVPQSSVNVFDTILAENPNPKTIMPDPLFIYARQYSGNIEMMYGRDVQGYIVYTTQDRLDMFAAIQNENPDYGYIFAVAKGNDVDFIVIDESHAAADAEMQARFGYYEIAVVEGYRIYELK